MDALQTLLKANGQSVTKARLTVFGVLSGQEAVSMHELAERASGVDRASVYRTINLFERLGIVQRVSTGWKYKLELTDKFAAHHHHLTCTQCGRAIAINEADLEAAINKLAVRHGFAPSAHQIEIQGLCANCQRVQARS
ncbi:MAG TPA: Fur family transcriptional regulator [Candidatus Saccharimonadales bacterium]|nr:Fur family transcriptional regulator [Candidatus Saccharimonadales bacterium]